MSLVETHSDLPFVATPESATTPPDIFEPPVSKAVRSKDTDDFDYASAPILGWMAVARTAKEGATKYGRYNYMQGFPVHDLLNHALHHIHSWLLGDRSEPHLAHAGWNVLTAITMDILHPDMSKPHTLGPGATITPDVQAELDRNAPVLKAKRDAGEFEDIGFWKFSELPFVKRLVAARKAFLNAV